MTAITAAPRTGTRTRRNLPPVPVLVAGAILLVLAIAALWPLLFTSADPLATDPVNALQSPSREHPLGTDQLGRDLLTRLVYGARSSLTMGIGATAIAVALGTVLGTIGGISNGWPARAVNRLLDVLFAFPEMLIALVVVTIMGVGGGNVMVAIGIGALANYARVLRSEVLKARRSGYAESARGLGLHPVRIAIAHIIPNAIGPVLVLATMGVGTAITFGAGLSFIGLGVQPPDPEWGQMLSESRSYLSKSPLLGLYPGLLLTLAVISFTVVGRHLKSTYLYRTEASS